MIMDHSAGDISASQGCQRLRNGGEQRPLLEHASRASADHLWTMIPLLVAFVGARTFPTARNGN